MRSSNTILLHYQRILQQPIFLSYEHILTLTEDSVRFRLWSYLRREKPFRSLEAPKCGPTFRYRKGIGRCCTASPKQKVVNRHLETRYFKRTRCTFYAKLVKRKKLSRTKEVLSRHATGCLDYFIYSDKEK